MATKKEIQTLLTTALAALALVACGGPAAAVLAAPTTLAVACPPTCTASTDQPNEDPPPTSIPELTATPTSALAATPAPTVTSAPTGPSQHDLTLAYQAISKRDIQTTGDAMTTMGGACQRRDFQGCRAAMVDARNAVHAYQRDLDATPAPDCLTPVGGEIRAALGSFEDGLSQGISGIDNFDPNQITSGGNLITLGNSHLDSATLLIKQASC
jgi:hypothetical protein